MNNISIERLTEDKVELVRNWRNDPSISQHMVYKKHISKENQIKWFNSLDKDKDHYFIINDSGKDIGLTQIKNFNGTIGEGGIFIFEKESNNKNTVAIEASLLLYDYFFDNLKGKKVIAHILKENKLSIIFSRLIGYQKESEDSNGILMYSMNKERYIQYKTKILKSLQNEE